MLRLQEEMLQFVQAQAQDGYPYEVCGLLGGSGGRVLKVQPMRNIANDPRVRYVMDPEELLAAFQNFEANGWDLLAIYHSHPAGPSYPSETDIAESYYPDVVYLIINLAVPHAPEITAWTIRDGRASPAVLQVVTS